MTFTTISACAESENKNEMRWFRNELTCEDTKVTVRSFCKDEKEYSINSFCTAQSMSLEKNGERITIRNLLKNEPVRDNFHTLGSVRCVMNSYMKPYLYLILDNGGNCDGCEINAVMDLNGDWKMYDKKWFSSGQERKEIKKGLKIWFRSPETYIENKVLDKDTK